jgi:hypothetical protein
MYRTAYLAGVQQKRDEPLTFASSVSQVRELEALERAFGTNSTAAAGTGIQAVGEVRRVSMNDFRPTPDPAPQTATTYLGGLQSFTHGPSNVYDFAQEARRGGDRFPYFAPGQENTLQRY